MSGQIHPGVAYYQSTGTLPPPSIAPTVATASPSSSSGGGPALIKPPLGTPGNNPSLPGPLGALNSFSKLGDLLQAVTSPGFWIRVGQFLLGGIFLLIGVYLMASESAAGQRIKSQAETAAVVAAA